MRALGFRRKREHPHPLSGESTSSAATHRANAWKGLVAGRNKSGSSQTSVVGRKSCAMRMSNWSRVDGAAWLAGARQEAA